MAKCDKSDVIGYDPTLIANAWAVSLSKGQQYWFVFVHAWMCRHTLRILFIIGFGGSCRQRVDKGYWDIKLHNHKDGKSAEDCQNSACSKSRYAVLRLTPCIWRYNHIVECHVYLQQPKLQQYCKAKGTATMQGMLWVWFYNLIIIGIALEAYAPLGSPTRMSPSPDEPVVMEDPVVKEIASKHGATPAQVRIYNVFFTCILKHVFSLLLL